jgi:hypothetical protein
MAQNLIEAQGGQKQKPTRFVSLFTSRFISGMYTNRSLLRGPLQAIYSDFYHLGATDALCDGLNSEISIRQTAIRRPGNYKYCTQQTAAAIDGFYSFHEASGSIQVIADSLTDVEVVTPTSITSIFTKSAGAGQGYFQGINQTLYITDGVDFETYTPGILNPNTGKPVWNMGGAGPTVAPTLVITPTGSAGVAWAASTMFTTMGLLVDAANNVQQLVSVNASGTNSTNFGTSANGAPDFSGGPGTSVTESTGTPITWTNWGPVVAWSPHHNYTNYTIGGTDAAPSVIYDPVSKSCYFVDNPSLGSGQSGSTKPPFNGVAGSIFNDGSIKWYCLGNSGAETPGVWKPGTVYPVCNASGSSWATHCIVAPTTIAAAGIGSANSTPVYLWVSSGGTSGNSAGYIPSWATSAGNPTLDGDLVWNCLGSSTWAAHHNYLAWTFSSTNFSVVRDGGNLYVCISSTGPSGAVSPTFNTGYGQQTQDGTNPGTAAFIGVTWTCVGTSLSWAPATQWYYPDGGFVPPQPSQAYGGATLVDTNGNNQYVINSGKSKTAPHPTWAAIGSNTTDGTVTWFAASKFTSAGFAWTKGYGYVYEYYARTASDYYNTNSPPLQIPNTNSPNITGPLGPPVGNQSGAITNASPLTQIVGGDLGAQVLITMVGSTDPQYDTILVFRSADGFGASGPYLFLTAIPMPPMQGALPGIAQIIDYMPDLPTNLLPGLDPLQSAAVGDENSPPPGSFGSSEFTPAASATPTLAAPGTGLIGLVYWLGRMWGFVGNTVFASGGPDTMVGNGFTSWPAINSFPFDSNIVRLMPSGSWLIVFTTTDIYVIAGGPAIADFYSQLLAPGVGLLSWNAVTMMLGLPYLFSSDRQFITIDPSGGFTRIGHPIGDKLVAYDPSLAYVTYHSYGDREHALFVANGSSEWYRCDPNPTPDSQLTGPIWSPKAVIAAGFKAVMSIETSPGVKQLLIGPPAAGYILARDSNFTVFADNASTYDSYLTMGNIVLAHPGQMAELAFVECDFTQVGSQPTVLVLLDELSATNGAAFESISNEFISDPPEMYGPTATPKTLWMNRYYFGQTSPGNPNNEPIPAWCKFLQLRINFGNDTAQNELQAFSIFGALYQER